MATPRNSLPDLCHPLVLPSATATATQKPRVRELMHGAHSGQPPGVAGGLVCRASPEPSGSPLSRGDNDCASVTWGVKMKR